MPSPRMPALAARGAEHRPRRAAPVGRAPRRRQAAGARSSEIDEAGRGLDRDPRQPRRVELVHRLQRHADSGHRRAPGRSGYRAPFAASTSGSQPRREASHPTSRSAATAESVSVADRDRADLLERRAPLRWVERGGDPLPPRRAAQPGQVDDIGARGQLAHAGERRQRCRVPRRSRAGSRWRAAAANRRPPG